MLKNNIKFVNQHHTADGSDRAFVNFNGLNTLWFNTGTLCNIACKDCYIDSSPLNDKLLYLDLKDVKYYINEIQINNWSCKSIGFTGGEPFMNKDIIASIEFCLEKGFEVLVLTNAMQPMQNKIDALKKLSKYQNLKLRISLDHFSKYEHEKIRGEKTWDKALLGIKLLIKNNFKFTIASRILNNKETAMRDGFNKLFKLHNVIIDAYDPKDLILFPEMSMISETPEITTKCWSILGVDPVNMMCADSRMIVKRKEDRLTHVVACTLIPYENDFSYGKYLKDSFKKVYLKHPHCSKFCVLGGASCSNN